MNTTPSTIRRHDFNSPEVAEPLPEGRHRDESCVGAVMATFRDKVTENHPTHPIATYVGKHRKAVAA